MTTGDDVIVEAGVLRDFVAEVFRRLGVPDDDAATGADVLVTADLRGVGSHGVSNMLPLYLDWFAKGEIRPQPAWRVVRESASTANVDADRGLGIFLAPTMMRMAIDKARETGIGMVTLGGGRHLGMCAYHAMMPLDHSMIGMCMTATGPLMLPTHGREPRLGTNPLAVAVPTGRPPPFVFDAAMSVIPGNKVVAARRTGSLLPGGVVADEEGRPITEPTPAPDSIRLLPLGSTPQLGSHKGYGLAMVVEVLAGILSGAGFGAAHGFDVANHALAAIDIGAFVPVDDFLAMMDDYLTTLRSTPPVPGEGPVRIPGDPEWATTSHRLAHGIPLHPATVEWLERTGHELDLTATLRTDS